MKCYFLVIGLFVATGLFPAYCHSSQTQIEATGCYVVGDGIDETPTEAKRRAKQEAMRIALDKAGTYVESYSRTENLQLTTDEIRIVSSEVVQIVKETYDVDLLPNDVLQYIAHIIAVVDTDSIRIKLQEEQNRTLQMQREIAEMEGKYQKLKLENEQLIARDQSDLSELYKKATADGVSPTERLEIANEILQKDESFRSGAGYLLRGMAYGELQRFEEALEAEKKYLSMNPDDAYAYYYCALDYQNTGDIRNALLHINKAISLEPGNREFEDAKNYIRLDILK